jgi:hypothetical protein
MLRSLSYLALAVVCFVTNIATAKDSPPQAKTGPGELTPIDVSGFFSSAQHWRNAKLQSRCGMGVCQGRVCGAAAKVIWGWGMESVRQPVLPARVGSLILNGSSCEQIAASSVNTKPVL